MADYPTYPCYIGLLSDELLGDVIRRLEWRDRIDSAELVSRHWNRVARQYGWTDIREFTNVYFNTQQTKKLLIRCGHYVRELIIESMYSPTLLQQLIKLCPNVEHMRLRLVFLNSATMDCIGETLGRKLYSLTIEHNFQSAKLVCAINRLLSNCYRLEYLQIVTRSTRGKKKKLAAINGLKLPPQLRYFAVRECGQVGYDQRYQPKLREEDLQVVPISLRSLLIGRVSFPDLLPWIHLSALKNLTYLGIEVTERNEANFLTALGSMHSLRVLELIRPPLRTIEQFPLHCTPQLRHLTLASQFESYSAGVLRPLGNLPRELKSFCLLCDSIEGDWGWLEVMVERGRLEYVEISAEDQVPIEVVIKTIRICKSLHVLDVSGHPTTDGHDQLLDAAEQAEIDQMRENNSTFTSLPIIRMCIYSNEIQPVREGRTNRIKWINYEEFPGPSILQHHQYGMLSAEAPRWAKFCMQRLRRIEI